MYTALPRRQPWIIPTLLLFSIGAILACSFLPQVIAIAVPLLIASAIALRYPAIGLIVLMTLFLIQASPLYTSYGVFARSLTAADGLAVLVLAGYLLQRKLFRTYPAARGQRVAALTIVCAYFGWGIVSIFWSPAPISALSQYARSLLEAVLLFGLSILILDEPAKVRRAAGTYALAGIGLAVYTIFHFQSKHGFNAAGNLLYQGHVYRGGSLGAFNSNELSIILSLIPAFTFLATETRGRSLRLLSTGATVPIAGLALVVLTSREVFVAAALALSVGIVLAHGARHRLALIGVAALALVVYALLSVTNHLPYYFQNRITQAGYDNIGHRLPGWMFGLHLVVQHPLGGAGALGFETMIPGRHITIDTVVTSPHSDYVGALANTGLVGFALLIVMIAVLGHIIVFGGRRNPASIGIFVILVTEMAVGSWDLSHWFWVAVSIACCFGLTRETERVDEGDAVPDSARRNVSQGLVQSGANEDVAVASAVG